MKESVRRHFDGIAGRYDAYKAANRYYYDSLKALFAELLPDCRQRSVLELGCGTGQVLAALCPRRGVGVDISPAMIDRARLRCKDRPELLFLVGDAEELGLQGPSFDACIAPDVLEHVERPQVVLGEAARLLKPGGLLIVSLINPRWGPLLALAERLALKMPEGNHRWVDLAKLHHWASDCGLAAMRSGYRLLLPKRVPLLSDWVNRRFYRWGPLQQLGCVQFIVMTRR